MNHSETRFIASISSSYILSLKVCAKLNLLKNDLLKLSAVYILLTVSTNVTIDAKSVDPDQTAPTEAV